MIWLHPNPFLPHPTDPNTNSNEPNSSNTRHLTSTLYTSSSRVPSLTESCHRLLLRRSSSTFERNLLHFDASSLLDLPSHLLTPFHTCLPLSRLPHSFDPRGSVCISPVHAPEDEVVFVQHMEERFEWRQTICGLDVGVERVPVRWRGCSRGCLDWLKEAGMER
jgi:hypothetical protein